MLEILRQKQVFVLLRDIATENKSQVVIVTHSEVILDAALETNLTLLLEGRADNLAKKVEIHESLKLYGTAHYIRARQRGYVFYVEGGTDVDILRALAGRLNHRAAAVWDENPNVFFVENVHDEPSMDSELERVEGGFGITPREHFNKLRKLLPGLQGLAILDNDGRARQDFEDQGLRIRYWKRYEIENYFITPVLLLGYAAKMNLELGLFAMDAGLADEVMSELIQDRVFWGRSRRLPGLEEFGVRRGTVDLGSQDTECQAEQFRRGIFPATLRIAQDSKCCSPRASFIDWWSPWIQLGSPGRLSRNSI